MTPISGTLSLSQVRAELGLAGAFSMSNANARKLSGVLSGVMSLSQFRACQWIGVNNYPNPNAYSTPNNIKSRVVLAPGLSVFGNSYGTYALFVGVGLNADVTFDNYGTIMGASGVPNSGAGGNAFYTYCGSNTEAGRHGNLTINNYGSILAGGGAGGVGGTGGTGGGGYYVTTGQEGDANTYSSAYHWYISWTSSPSSRRLDIYWAGNLVFSDFYYNQDYNGVGGYTYYRGNQKAYYPGNDFGQYGYIDSAVYRTYQYNVYTSGGAGGAGGRGGYGQGYDYSQSGGLGGNGGSPPGTNAGWGGTGGTGGWGGGWGAWGITGNTGAAGGSGNNGGGGAGYAGGGGGPPGYWYLNSSGDVSLTLNNAGTILGR